MTFTAIASLVAALKSAAAGTVLSLAPGNYGAVVISDLHARGVTVTSADPSRPAVIEGLVVRGSSGITFKELTFTAPAYGGSPDPSGHGAGNVNAFQVLGSRDVHFDRLKVGAAPQSTLATATSGFLIRQSSDITVTRSDFSGLHNALGYLSDTHLTVAGNSFHNLWDDAMRGGDTSFLTIDGNHCFSNHPDPADTDHPDCLQMWTTNTTQSAHDIVIANNRYDRGAGLPTQFIFLGNEQSVPYLNVKITGNVAYGAAWNGIAVQNARNVEISGNLLVSDCRPVAGAGGGRSQVIVSRILTGSIDGLTVKDNAAGQIGSRGADTGVVGGRNRVTECKTPRSEEAEDQSARLPGGGAPPH